MNKHLRLNKFNKFVLMLFLLFGMAGMTKMKAFSFIYNGIAYDIISGTTTVEVVYNPNGVSGSVYIPNTVSHSGQTYTVVGIYSNAFVEERISSISFASTSTITYINANAFLGTKISTLTIPNSVTSLGEGFCAGCSNLNSVTLGSGVTSIPASSFAGCEELTSITINGTISSIGAYAFSECPLNSYAVPNSVTSISTGVFKSCTNLTSVTLGTGVTSIPESAFEGCTLLSTININGAVTNIGASAFKGCTSLTTFPNLNALTSISAYAFQNSGLTAITIPAAVTTIGNYAFSGCTHVTAMTVAPATPPTIGSNTFYNVPKNIPVAIPCASAALYRTTSGWSEFSDGFTDENCVLEFADANVKAICVDHWDTNGDGELSHAETFAVTSLGTLFCNNTTITSFNELQYFLGLTSIGNYAFQNCTGLTTIEIPNSVTSIGNYAFQNCTGLTTIEIPNSVTSIGNYAFDGCSGLTTLNYNAINASTPSYWLNGCSSLSNVTIGNTVQSIPSYFMYNRTGLTSVTIPNSVTSIGNNAFSSCRGLTSLTIPNSVTSIGQSAFSSCTGLTSVTIGNSVTSIGDNAFSGCTGLTTLNYNAINASTPSYLLNGCSSLSNVTIGNTVQSIPSYFVYNCTGLTSVTIPNSVTSIGQSAFYGCRGLTTLTIGNSVTSIGNNAFYNCNGLEQIVVNSGNTVYDSRESCNAIIRTSSNELVVGCMNTVIPNSVTSIGSYAFYNCSGLTSVTIPNSVTSIGNYAFYGCTGLTTLTIGNSVTSIGNYAFCYCPSLTSVTIPNSVTSIGNYAFSSCSGLTSVTIGNSVTSIGEWAFQNCSGLTTLTIGNSVTSIGNNAFYNCNGLEQIIVESGNTVYDSRESCNAIIRTSSNELVVGCMNTVIPNSVTSIGFCAFLGCSGLTSVTIPNSVTSIGQSAFSGCSGLTSVTIPNSVTSIGRFAFSSCTGLTSVTIGNSVTSIGEGAFVQCNLSSIYYTGTVEQWCELDGKHSLLGLGGVRYALYINNGLVTDLSIPSTVTEIKTHAFDGAICLTSVTIPNSVTSIGYCAFQNCSGLTSLTIGNSVTSIGGGAFFNCAGLTSMTVLADNPPTLDYNAFYNVNMGIPVYVPSGSVAAYQNASGWSDFSNIIAIGPGTITVTASPAEGGTVTGGGYFEGGATCTLTAMANEGYSFINWTEDGNQVSSNANYSFTVTGARTLVANFQIGFHFTTPGNWTTATNWVGNTLPSSNDDVIIHAACTLDQNATVSSLTVENGNVLTVQSGKTLNVTGTLTNAAAENLVVADGGQLITDNAVVGTVQKHIEAFTSNDDGWNFIASPVTTSLTASTIDGLIPSGETVYDLYYLDEEHTKWFNYKDHDGNANAGFDIVHKKGYLYANGAGTTVNFGGTLQPHVAAGVTINLANTGDGWNLVGNPFTFNAYADKSYYIINGRNVEASASGAIAPCTGIVVKATGGSETVTFTKNNPAANSNQGNLNIVVAEQTATRDGASSAAVDKAIVSFNEGSQLEKFVFNADNAKLYIPQNGEDYAIAIAEKQGEMPLNFKATRNGTYTISVNPEGVNMAYLHLIDNTTGADVDLLQTPEYTFSAKTSDYESRFKLVFVANNEDGTSTGSETFAFISNGNIVITDATANATLQIVDVMGRILRTEGLSQCGSRTIAGLTPGVYVLRLIDGNNVRTQKMVIQ